MRHSYGKEERRLAMQRQGIEVHFISTEQCPFYNGGHNKKGVTMTKYRVIVGVTEAINCMFDCLGDAIDFASICIQNGYRVTIIPVNVEEE